MNLLFVPRNEALELKQLGFIPDLCLGYYYTLNGSDWEFADQHSFFVLNIEWDIHTMKSARVVEAPLYDQAFHWFNEVHGMHSYIDSFTLMTSDKEVAYDYVIIINDDLDESDDGRRWKTPIEAKRECIIELIEIVKSKYTK